MATVAEYGSWQSDLTPAIFGQGNCGRLAELQVHKESLFWLEQNISTGKRELYESADGGVSRKRWADGFSVQNAVHEYGGGSFVVLPDSSLLFTTVDGVWRQANPDQQAKQVLDSQSKTRRYADFGPAPDGRSVLAVEEVHGSSAGSYGDGAQPINRLISINLDDCNTTVIASGCDFYAQPRISPDGRFVSWMQWNHINMPWDETEVLVHRREEAVGGAATEREALAKLSGVGRGVNFYCPTWHPTKPGHLFVICDQTNFWNLYEVDVESDDKALKNIYPVDEEIGFPLWQFADRPFASNGILSVMNVNGRIYVREEDTVRLVKTSDFNNFSHLLLTPNGILYAIALGPKRAATIVRMDVKSGELSPVRESRSPAAIDKFDISEPQRVDLISNGVPIHGYYYAPKNSAYSAPEGILPPCLLVGHPGPTLPTSTSLDFKKQFFTTRGIAVFDVCYRGSSGCGTAYRNMLKREWGIVDRDDFLAAAAAVVEKKLADPRRLLLMGSSSSGFTLLACLIHSPPSTFAAAVSIYGVADLIGLAKETHKFEIGYNEGLLGKLPDEEEEYKRRSPMQHIDKIRTPCAFLHGLEDTVVPVQQSIEMHKKLKENGVTTGILLFPGEGHGFRGETAVRESIEAAYFFMAKAIGVEPSVQSKMEIFNLPAEVPGKL